MIVLWLATAFAQTAPPEPTVRDRIEEAIAARQPGRQADVDAARSLLVAIEPSVTDDDRALYLFQRGICEELTWHLEPARAFYDQVIALGPSPVQLDAHFRRALVLEDMGEDEAAFADLVYIDHQRGLEESGELTLALQRGISELAIGRRNAGIRRIEAALEDGAHNGSITYMRAKAQYALIEARLQEANELPLKGSQRHVVRNLAKRAERIEAAQNAIIELTQLQEPEWVLASLIALGDAYALVGDDLLGAPFPHGLNAIQARVYEVELGKKVQNVRNKALHCYQQGVALAERLQWESPNVRALVERTAELLPKG